MSAQHLVLDLPKAILELNGGISRRAKRARALNGGISQRAKRARALNGGLLQCAKRDRELDGSILARPGTTLALLATFASVGGAASEVGARLAAA
ncbi:MAG: hypothetical protein GY725_19850 [bacterium]|nr:hypothetical protein [bacterium]